MISLDTLLEFHSERGPSTMPPCDAHIAVSDTMDSPATFVLIHYLQVALQSGRQVVWIDSSGNGWMHLVHIARKMVR